MSYAVHGLDVALTSVAGAQEVISTILSRRLVARLILGHNELGDDGCEELFNFLRSDLGRKYKISEISLNSNKIGDRGLFVIARYLEGNTTLGELFLQNNDFVGDAEVVSSFTAALNSSRLETLCLSTNSGLSDTFASRFLPALDCPYLHELQISALGLTRTAAPYIIEYISSPRCRLHSLQMNGNRLGLRAMQAIVRAHCRSNFSIVKTEMYASLWADGSDDEHEVEVRVGEDRRTLWKESERLLRGALDRNKHLQRQTEREAFALLRYARATLLYPKGMHKAAESCRAGPSSGSDPCVSPSVDSLFSSIGTPVNILALGPPVKPFLFSLLPTELQLYILSFLAPTLSTSQRLRIVTYASSRSTLPPLLPSLYARDCPASYPVSQPSELSAIGGSRIRRRPPADVARSLCVRKSQTNRRQDERFRWLTEMKCDVYEVDPDMSFTHENDGAEGSLANGSPHDL
ncbi:hypothetical protein BKA93DRAFT_799841 [Sparassis latifolia]